jgi:hypothetical protein
MRTSSSPFLFLPSCCLLYQKIGYLAFASPKKEEPFQSGPSERHCFLFFLSFPVPANANEANPPQPMISSGSMCLPLSAS